MALNLIRLPYIAEAINKKDGFVVMFPDQSGCVYHFNSVPVQLQAQETREKYLQEKNITPVAKIYVAPDGCLSLSEVTNPRLMVAIVALLETRFGVSYLVGHRYITEQHAIGMIVTGFVSNEAMAPEDAVRASNGIYETIKRKQQQQYREWLGTSDRQVAKLSANPGTVAPESTVTVDVEAVEASVDGVTTTPRNRKKATAQ